MRKKVVRMRGSKTHGYGSKKKHRGKGSRGGKGLANIFKHKRVWVKKKRPDLLERNVGFKSLQQRGIRKDRTAINVSDLEALLKGNGKTATQKGPLEVDLSEHGIGKLLGSGEIRVAVKVRVGSYTAKAEEKIQKAGGQIITDEE